MFKLYIANKNYSSWSLRPWALLTAQGIPFEEILVPFPPGSSWNLYRPFAPAGRVPVLHDGDLKVWDSLAIIEYVAEQYPGVWPKDRVARAWSRSAAAEMHSGFQTLRNLCSMNIGLRVTLNQRPPELEKDLTRIAELWAEGRARFGGPYLAGPGFTAIDAFFAPVVFRAQTYGILTDAASAAYCAHMLAHPALKEWQTAALTETWRELHHEAEAKASGSITADLRAR